MEVLAIPSSSYQWGVRQFTITACLIVSGKLSEDLLKQSLRSLVDVWPRLGGRLVRFADSRQVYLNVQKRDFEDAIRFTRIESSVCLAPLVPTSKPGLQSLFAVQYGHLFQAVDCPKSNEEMINRPDVPTLWVHVAEHADVTCIGMTVPHCIYDILGLGEVLRQWCLLINGGSARAVPCLQPEDVVEDLGIPINGEARAERLSTLTIAGLWYNLRFAVRLFWNLFKAGKEDRCMVFVPQSFIAAFKAAVVKKFDIFVSTNDVLSALIAQQAYLTGSRRLTQLVNLTFAANLRDLLPDVIGGPDRSKVYLGSAVSYMTTQAREAREWQAMPLEEVILNLRRTAEAQRTPEQVALTWEQIQDGGKAFLKRGGKFSGMVKYAPWNVDQIFIASWTKAALDQLDFSGAALPSPATSDHGKLFFYGGFGVPSTISRRDWGIIAGKGTSQNCATPGYWIEFGYSRRQRAILEEWTVGLWQFERRERGSEVTE